MTIPNGSVPPFGNLGFFPGPVFHGENGIWASFGLDGTVAWQPAMGPGGGIYGVKFLWYFAGGVSGPFRVTGKRLDATAPPLLAETADQAAPGFSPSGLRFPSFGCWQITATAGDHAMTFTIWLYEGAPKLLRSDWTSPSPPPYCHVTRQPSIGVHPDEVKRAPANTIAVGNDTLAAFLPPDGTFEVTATEAQRDVWSTPYRGVVLAWWQNPSNEIEPLISAQRTAGYGGGGAIDYDLEAATVAGMRRTSVSFSSPGCWQLELRAGQVSTTVTIWLWTKKLPPLATPIATPAGE